MLEVALQRSISSNSFFKKLDRFMFWVTLHLPLTYMNILWRLLDKRGTSILDVGCGRGNFMKITNRRRKYYSVGVDLFLPYLKEDKARKIYDEYILCDVRFLPFRKNSFDIVLCLEVVEHLRKNQWSILNEVEDIARMQVIVTTPVSFHHQDEYDGNPLQTHKSAWTPMEFCNLGYSVRGHGLRSIYLDEKMIIREYGLRGLGILARPMQYVAFLVSYMLRPIVYFFPTLGDHMICVKSKACSRGISC